MTVDTDISVRLIGVLRDAAGMPGLEYERRPEPMRGGFWADIFSFSLANPPQRSAAASGGLAAAGRPGGRRLLASRFVRGYRRQAGAGAEPGELRWHQAVVCLRALTEVAGWVHEGTAGTRAGHPWLVLGPALAGRLAALTGAPVRAR